MMSTIELVKSRKKLNQTLEYRGFFINIYEGLPVNSFVQYYWEAEKGTISLVASRSYCFPVNAVYNAKKQIDLSIANL